MDEAACPPTGELLTRRTALLAALSFLREHPGVNADRVVMIGHCFGGLCALDLARAAPAGLVGAISVHAPPGEAIHAFLSDVLG